MNAPTPLAVTTHPSFTLSMLDLVAVREGHSVRHALDTALATAQHAERLGFTRYWLAEHHNMAGIASSATAVMVGHIAGGTSRIRVGSGGIMLPNHAPLVVAEAFGTLAELYPERIDLGLGRAPGTDRITMRALRQPSEIVPGSKPTAAEAASSVGATRFSAMGESARKTLSTPYFTIHCEWSEVKEPRVA